MGYELFNAITGPAASECRDPEDAALAVLLDCTQTEVDWLRLAVLLSGVSLTPGEETGLQLVLEHQMTLVQRSSGVLALYSVDVPERLQYLREACGESFRELLRVIGEAAK